ncbi:MAG: hypothetical protein JWO61_185 [Candidatus Saccharibacteria bacterium]|nr:hypothetical protein [Candidatus Saccharibacteria bacterium]
MDSYSYSTSADYSSNPDPGVAIAIIIGAIIFAVVLYVVFSYFLSKIFKKAGEDGWKAWVPIYNNWVFLELGGQKGWIALLSLVGAIPIIGWLLGIVASVVVVVFMALAAYNIGLHLQKEPWFVVLYIMVSGLWIIWLAVDSSTWQAPGVAATNAAPGYQPPIPPQQTQTPQIMTPQDPVPNQDNTPPTPPLAS